ncbi:hypothetical protein OROHE_024469 [Orobanche hederae]
MASSSFLLSPLSSATTMENRALSCHSTGLAFIHNPTLLFAARPRKVAFRRCGFKSPFARKSLDHIPKQFREENLKDGLMDNYKNVPQHLYGLLPSEMDVLFMKEDSPIRRQVEKVTEENISSAFSHSNNGGMWSMSGVDARGLSMHSTSAEMHSRRARGRKSPPPDAPSMFLDARIIVLFMPIAPVVCELIIQQFLWLQYDGPKKPIYLYINSPGIQNYEMENVGHETDAHAIADVMALCEGNVCTLNAGMAYGQAAMLLSLGTKGYRMVWPTAVTGLYLPKIYNRSGTATEMSDEGNELVTCKDTYIKYLAKGIGKSKEEIEKDIQRQKFFDSQEAIDYGIADKIGFGH